MADKQTELPTWLTEYFPGRTWTTFRSCRLRVGQEAGAGLDMEESDLGYSIDAVDAKPGQDDALQAGRVIIGIGTQGLLGLTEEKLGEVFGENFRHDAEVFSASADELQEARIEREKRLEYQSGAESEPENEELGANWELLWRPKTDIDDDGPATVQIPVGRGRRLLLAPSELAALQQEMRTLGSKIGLEVQPRLLEDMSIDVIQLIGLPSKIAAARPTVVEVLHKFRDAADGVSSSGPAAKRTRGDDHAPEADDVENTEVETTACSLPAHVKDLRQFMYHDHTADIIVQSWGKDRAESFAQAVVGMFSYMTELDQVDIERSVEVEATGHDLLDLLYHLLDEFLFVFGSEFHVSRCVEILEFDEPGLRIKARGYGERMDLKKHEQGTEIKAITMHMMKILGPEGVMCEQGTVSKVAAGLGEVDRPGFPFETYVLHDI
eukprot:TRINITY_DN7090_c0_g1_i1.p1 TRINITY_DN7090_c0_g1~~TRINITY_DN7090_c0_g1_i1.p1  ORF type:complete len:437 (+),score=93.69 TRINITY_DN7090_c0_g1_i1:64-1374(+)